MTNPLGLPDDFYALLPKTAQQPGPIYYLWVYDPQTGKVLVENTDDKPRAEHRYHLDLAQEVPHPGRVHGYAYPIQGGYRITDWEHRPLADQYIKHQVVRTLDGKAGSTDAQESGSHYARRVLKSKYESRDQAPTGDGHHRV